MANDLQQLSSVLTGPKLKAIRALRGVTQQELAELANVTQPAIAAFESGKREMRTDTLRRICKALNVKVQYIIDDTIITGP